MVLDAIADIAIFIIGHFWLILQMSRGANVVVIIVVFFFILIFCGHCNGLDHDSLSCFFKCNLS